MCPNLNTKTKGDDGVQMLCPNLNTKTKASKAKYGVQMYVSELITAHSRSTHEMVLAPCVIPLRFVCVCMGGGGAAFVF